MTNHCDRCKMVNRRHSFDCLNHPLRLVGGVGRMFFTDELRIKVPNVLDRKTVK